MLRRNHEAGSVHNHFFESQNAGESTCRRLHLFSMLSLHCCLLLAIFRHIISRNSWQRARRSGEIWQSTTETVWLQRSPNEKICDGVFHTMCREIAYIGSTWFTRQWMEMQWMDAAERKRTEEKSHRKRGDESKHKYGKNQKPVFVLQIATMRRSFAFVRMRFNECLPCLCI